MNEDIMRQFQKMPDSRLLEKIHVRLERRERVQKYKNYLIRSLLVLMLVFGSLMTFSATARAVFAQSIEQSREFFKCYIGSNPIGRHIAPNRVNCSGDGILTITPSENLSLDDAQTRFPSPIDLPANVPPGFERRTDTEFFDIPSQPALVITWDRQNHWSLIKLLISHNSFDIKEYVQTLGKGAIEETLLDGKPAILVRGVWNIGTSNNDFMMTALIWRYDEDTIYSLMSLEQAIPLEELFKMAESIP